MFTVYLSTVITRELATLREEILAYSDETDIWKVPDGISNSAGTLALHLAGNLQHFVGAVLGGSGYLRQRDREFADRDLPREDLLRVVDDAVAAVRDALAKMTDAELESAPPFGFGEISVNAAEFVVHLVSHLSYHLGQVNYHRRLVTGVKGNVSALAIPGLSTAGR